MKLSTICTAVLCFFFFQQSYSQTQVSGGMYQDETWTKANSPYIITGDITVFSGFTLTIEPGVIVRFQQNVKIILRGKLVAIGNKSDSIHFTSDASSPTPGDYQGIASEVNSAYTFGAQITQIKVKYAVVEYADNFLDFRNAGGNGPYYFENCRFTNNKNVIKELNASCRITELYFDNCLFNDNVNCLNGGGEDQNLYIKNCWFVNNSVGAAGGYISGCVFKGNTKEAAYLYHEIRNSYIFDNAIGARVDMHHDTKFTNNEIYGNDIGVIIDRMTKPTPGILFEKNKICNNNTWNVRYDFTHNIDLTDNCWCTNDSATVASLIRDGYDDVTYGLVKFEYSQSCSTSAPPPPGTQSVIENNNTKNNKLRTVVFPNPTNNYINITNTDDSSYSVSLISIDGKLLSTWSSLSGESKVDLSTFKKGQYFLQVTYDNGSETELKRIAIY